MREPAILFIFKFYYIYVVLYLCSASCCANQSEALPVRET